jgi:hypothetical protein
VIRMLKVKVVKAPTTPVMMITITSDTVKVRAKEKGRDIAT